MTDEAKRFLSLKEDAQALREIEWTDCAMNPRVCITMIHKAADLIESLAAELEQVKRERDGLSIMLTQAQTMLETRTRERDVALAEIKALNEEYFVDIHTARDPMAEKVKQLERERDAAVEELRKVCQATEVCFCCKSHNTNYTEYVSNDCMDCIRHCNWQWRGVKKED